MLKNEAILLIFMLIHFKREVSLECLFLKCKYFFFTNAKMTAEFWEHTNNCREIAEAHVTGRCDISEKHHLH